MSTTQYTVKIETLAQNAFADDVVRAIARKIARQQATNPAAAKLDAQQHMSVMDTQERKIFAHWLAVEMVAVNS